MECLSPAPSRLPFPFPGDLPNPGLELKSPALQEDSLPSDLSGKTQNYQGNFHSILRFWNNSGSVLCPLSPVWWQSCLLSHQGGVPPHPHGLEWETKYVITVNQKYFLRELKVCININFSLLLLLLLSLQSCPTLCDPIDSSPPGFPVPGILQARTLEWVAISFSNA